LAAFSTDHHYALKHSKSMRAIAAMKDVEMGWLTSSTFSAKPPLGEPLEKWFRGR